jgi:hypothetical protein
MKLLVISQLLPVRARAKARPALLPETGFITIPAGLDWVIRQRLTSVIAAQLISGDQSQGRVDALMQLDVALSISGRRDIHRTQLYGFELSVLYSFLLRQERTYGQWRANTVPDRAALTIRAQLRGFLSELHAQCCRVDLSADRPLSSLPQA